MGQQETLRVRGVSKQDKTDLTKHETYYESVEMKRTAETLKANVSA